MKAIVSPTNKRAFVVGEDNVIDAISNLVPAMGLTIEVESVGSSTLCLSDGGSIHTISIIPKGEHSSNSAYHIVKMNHCGYSAAQIDSILK